MIQVRYPYDPTGLDDGNIIPGERYALSSLDNTFRCIVPQLAPFYRHGLQVVHWPSGKELTEGKDYYLVSHSNLSSEIADLPLYGIIAFINPDLAGEIELKQYRTVGGNWVDVHKAVFERLANYLTNPANVNWSAVLDELDALPAIDHDQSWSDFNNTTAIAAAIDRITTAMQAKADGGATAELNALEQRLKALQDTVAVTEFDKHIGNLLNPHQLKAADVSALPAGTQAIDAFKMFGMTLLEFTDYIKSKMFSAEDYQTYLAKHDSAATDFRFQLEDGVARIGNGTMDAAIDINGFSFTVTMNTAGRLLADKNRGLSGKTVTMRAGNNTLKVVSKGATYDEDSLLINDKVVIHVGNIRRYINSFSAGYFYLTVADSATVNLTGDGSKDKPLKLEALYNANPQAAASIGKIATTYGNDPGLFAVAKLLNDLGTSLTGYVPKTTLVCGKALSGDITLTKSDIGLPHADNTADADKPISTDQQTLLDQYSDVDHTHGLDELNVPYSSYEQNGITFLKSTDFGSGDAVTPSVFKDVTSTLTTWQGLLASVVDRDAIAIMALYTGMQVTNYPETQVVVEVPDPNAPTSTPILLPGETGTTTTTTTTTPTTFVPTVTEKWAFVIEKDQLMCYNGRVYKGIGATFSLYTLFGVEPAAGTKAYLYAKVNSDGSDTFTYQLSKTVLGTTDTRILAAEIVAGANGVATASYPAIQSFGDVADITDHVNDYNGHRSVPLPFNALNIRMVENKEVCHSISPLSPWSMANDWTNVFQDANTSGVILGVDPVEQVLTVDTASMGANATGWKYGGLSSINMWDNLKEYDADYNYGTVFLLVHHKVTTDSQKDVAARALCPIVGGMTNVLGQTSAIIMAPAGAAGDITPYQTILPYFKFSDRGTVAAFTAPYVTGDPYDVEVGLGANAGYTPVMHILRWQISRTTGKRSIVVETRIGELKNKGDILYTRIDEENLTLASHMEAFASGRFGWAINGHGQSKVWAYSKLNAQGDKYASANMLIEAMATTSKLRVITGVVSGDTVPMPAGCSKAIVIKTVNQWSASGDATNRLTDLIAMTWWRAGDSNNDNPVTEPYIIADTDPLWRLAQITAGVSNSGGALSSNPATARYMVIGIPNQSELTII